MFQDASEGGGETISLSMSMKPPVCWCGTGECGWPMAKLSALVSDNAEAFKAIVREFVSEVQAAVPAS